MALVYYLQLLYIDTFIIIHKVLILKCFILKCPKVPKLPIQVSEKMNKV